MTPFDRAWGSLEKFDVLSFLAARRRIDWIVAQAERKRKAAEAEASSDVPVPEEAVDESAVDKAWRVVKADTGMWDEIYAPLRAQTAGMGDLPHAPQTTDFVPTQFVMDKIRDMKRWNNDVHSGEFDDFMEELSSPGNQGDHGWNVDELVESILEHGFKPEMGGGSGQPDPSFRFNSEGMEQYEGRHRALALDRLGAPHIPYMGFYGSHIDTPHSMGLNPDFQADVMENTNEYSLGGYMGDKSRLMVPPSYLYGREMVPGMGRLLPVDRQGDPLDMHGHIHSDLGPEGQQWYDEQSWKVVHDE